MVGEEVRDICEICQEEIVFGVPQIRVVADAMIANGPAEYNSLIQNKVLIFASFHCSCLEAAEGDPLMDDVPYIWEARALLEELRDIGEEARREASSKKKIDRRSHLHLKVIRGGIR
jgi:hypothetical protein